MIRFNFMHTEEKLIEYIHFLQIEMMIIVYFYGCFLNIHVNVLEKKHEYCVYPQNVKVSSFFSM